MRSVVMLVVAALGCAGAEYGEIVARDAGTEDGAARPSPLPSSPLPDLDSGEPDAEYLCTVAPLVSEPAGDCAPLGEVPCKWLCERGAPYAYSCNGGMPADMGECRKVGDLYCCEQASCALSVRTPGREEIPTAYERECIRQGLPVRRGPQLPERHRRAGPGVQRGP